MFEGMTFVMDIDGTICPIKKKDQEYAELVPYPDIVAKMREYCVILSCDVGKPVSIRTARSRVR